MFISKGISYIRQMQRTYTKVLHETYSNVTNVFQITLYLILKNISQLDALKHTDQPIWLRFLRMTSHQTDHEFEYGMVS